MLEYRGYRGVAQLVARTAGGREVAGSSPVTPTTKKVQAVSVWAFFVLERHAWFCDSAALADEGRWVAERELSQKFTSRTLEWRRL
ncbi:MAG: hypothetical protein QG553_883 [Patescibacteria group bacterium]|nr:hypothetical protein [Patescibacteria group bacterium]